LEKNLKNKVGTGEVNIPFDKSNLRMPVRVEFVSEKNFYYYTYMGILGGTVDLTYSELDQANNPPSDLFRDINKLKFEKENYGLYDYYDIKILKGNVNSIGKVNFEYLESGTSNELMGSDVFHGFVTDTVVKSFSAPEINGYTLDSPKVQEYSFDNPKTYTFWYTKKSDEKDLDDEGKTTDNKTDNEGLSDNENNNVNENGQNNRSTSSNDWVTTAVKPFKVYGKQKLNLHHGRN